ncbi:MAG TPA: hypothetical protein DEQ27_01960 [Prevotella sp.]|nr:hypothetical protein [Prevotella sp.]
MKNITASFRIFIIGNLQLFYYAKNFYKRLLVSLSNAIYMLVSIHAMTTRIAMTDKMANMTFDRIFRLR